MTKKLDKMGKITFKKSDVEIVGSSRRYDGFFKLDRVELKHRLFNGHWSEPVFREIIQRKDAVGVLVYDPDLDAICLVQQFRSAIMDKVESPWPYELVVGLVDKEGESIEEVAFRELYEEAGVVPQYLEKINTYWMSLGGSNERMHVYLALANLQDAGGYHGLESESEDILALIVSREDARSWAFDRMESNASSIIALQWLENERERLAKVWQGCCKD